MKNNRFNNLKVNVLGRVCYDACYQYFGGTKKTNWLKRFIIEKQNYLEKRCISIWSSTNPENNAFIFGKFKDDETGEITIVTLGYKHKTIGWLSAR